MLLRQSLFQSGRPHIHWTRLIGWRGSICFREGCPVKAVTLSPNQLFIGSYLLFNLAAVCGIRLMAGKWLSHRQGPSAEKALGHCLFQRLSKKDEWDTLVHWELHHTPVYAPLWSYLFQRQWFSWFHIRETESAAHCRTITKVEI